MGSPSSPTTQFYYRVLRENIATLSAKHVLDVGCGVGGLFPLLIDLGAESITGIEPSSKNFTFVKGKYPDLHVFQSTLESFETDFMYDVVIISFVFEHIRDISIAMSKIRTLLKEGGVAYILTIDKDYAATPRDGYMLEVHDLNNSNYAIRTTRNSGVMYDLVRPIQDHIESGKAEGFSIVKHLPLIADKELIDSEKRFEKFKEVPFAHLLILS